MSASTRLRLSVGGVLLTFSLAAAAQNAVTADVARVYAGPDNSYPEVGELDSGSPLQVMGCLADWSWCDVVFGPNRGWIYSPEIAFRYEGGYVPFYSYAPALGVGVVPFSIDGYWGNYYHDRPWYRERDQWVHRAINHQRPPGPAPSDSLPPHEVVRAERPPVGSQPGQPLRLSSAEPSHRDAESSHRDMARPDGTAGHVDSRPDARAQEHAPPPAQPDERNMARPPAREEGRPGPAERMDTPRHEERRASPERTPTPPSREEQGDHPR